MADSDSGTSKTRYDQFYQVPDTFNHSRRHIGFAILDIENLTTDLGPMSPETWVRKISRSLQHFSKF